MNSYGGVVSVWDRLFGSFVSLDTTATDRFGCPAEVDSYPQRFRDALRRPPQDIIRHLSARPAAGRSGAPEHDRAAAA